MSELKVQVFPYREGSNTGNIIWAERDRGSAYYRVSKFAMNGGKFPKDHPVGGGSDTACQMGTGENIQRFRARGYWASCFPEGDGITWKPLNGQSDDQCLADIVTAFGWDVKWNKD